MRPNRGLGSLKPEIAADSRLGKLTIVAPATHDTGSAVAAVPFAHASGFDAFISCGTWALVGCELDRTVLSTEALTHNFTNEGGVAGTWRFLKNVAGLWLLEECRREWGETADYDVLEEEARGSSPFQSLIDPDEPGFVLPGDMTTRIRSFCRKTGQAEPNSRGEFVRCILESLALKFRTVLDDVETITGESLRNVHIVGGGCRNRLLCEWTATALGKPVLAGPAEATAMGNVLVQAMAVGRIDSLADARAVVANSVDVRIYEPGPRQPWEDVRDRFRSLWDA